LCQIKFVSISVAQIRLGSTVVWSFAKLLRVPFVRLHITGLVIRIPVDDVYPYLSAPNQTIARPAPAPSKRVSRHLHANSMRFKLLALIRGIAHRIALFVLGHARILLYDARVELVSVRHLSRPISFLTVSTFPPQPTVQATLTLDGVDLHAAVSHDAIRPALLLRGASLSLNERSCALTLQPVAASAVIGLPRCVPSAVALPALL
jgi:hypothetical protein